MEKQLLSRIENIRDRLDYESDKKTKIIMDSEGSRMVRKHKFQSTERGRRKNRYLSEKLQKFQKLYSGCVAEALVKFPDFELYSRSSFQSKLHKLVNGTKRYLIEWDQKWINPVQIVAKGWNLYSEANADTSVIALQCDCCHSLLYLDFDDSWNSQTVNERYSRKLTTEHTTKCPWRNHKYNLEQNYYLNRTNLFLEMQRILEQIDEARKLQYTVPVGAQKEEKLTSMFDVDEQLLPVFAVLLRGYTFVDQHVVTCSACCQKSFVTTLKDADYNGHALWCRYSDESQLAFMLSELQAKSLQDSYEAGEKNETTEQNTKWDRLPSRLKRLENCIERV